MRRGSQLGFECSHLARKEVDFCLRGLSSMVFTRRLFGTLFSKDLETHPQLSLRINLKQGQQLEAAIGMCTELRVTGFPLNKILGVISA